MSQCPACASYNEPGAAFCNQCGAALQPRRKTRRTGPPRKLFLGAIGMLLIALAVLILLKNFGSPGGNKPEEAEAPPQDSPPEVAGGPKDAPGDVDEAVEPAPLPPEAIQRRTDPAIALLELYDGAGERLRDLRGVLLEPGRTALCRFRPLFGAYSGKCKVGRGSEPPWEVRGLIAFDAYWNLALLEIQVPSDAAPLPSLDVPPSVSLQAGMEVSVVSVGHVTATEISEFPFLTPDGISHARLAAEPPLPAGAILAVDPYASVLGLCAPEPAAAPEDSGEDPGQGPPREAQRPRILLDPLTNLVNSLGRPAALSLAEVTRRFYEGTFADLLERGKKAHGEQDLPAAVDLLGKALDQAEREGTPESEAGAARDLLRRSFDELLDRLRLRKDARSACDVLAAAVQRFPQERGFWLDLGSCRIDLEDFAGAVAALLEGRRIEPGSDLDLLLQKAYIAGASREVALGRLQVAAEWLEKGIQLLPGSARLHLELARLYQRWGFLDDAARLYHVARGMDPGLGPEIDAALEEIDRAFQRREILVIKIPEGASSIQADVVLNGNSTFRFVIDTGATYTSISQEMAERLGYRIGPDLEHVVIGTANGFVTASLVTLESVNLQGYAVRNLKTLVLPQKAMSQVGLLGLNFLEHFRWSMDPGRREFRLERR